MNSKTNINFGSIGLFNESFLPIMDGVSITVKNYATWLNRKVSPTVVVTPQFPGYYYKEEFKVYSYFSVPLPLRPPYRLGVPFFDNKIQRNLSNIPFGIIHSHSPFSAGSMALKIARKNNIPIVGTFHSKFRDDFETNIPNRQVVDFLIKKIVDFYESVDEVWIPQAKVEDTIRSYGYKGKLEVVENGIDSDPSLDIDSFRSAGREKMGFSKDEFVFLYVGQHIWEKNLKFLLESLRLMQNLKFTALFVGEGYARARLEQLVNDYGLSKNIKFLGVVYDREQMKEIYATADLFLFPSLYDNAPLVLREAASMGTPSLLIKDSTAAEVIQDGYNGYIAENNVTSFYQKIKEIYCNSDQLRSVGLQASQTLCRSWENVIEEVGDRYYNLKNRSNRNKPEYICWITQSV